MHADHARTESDTVVLPAELMCAILKHLDIGWWPLAAQTCRWWRACVRMALANDGRVRFASNYWREPNRDTLWLVVCGGHVDVVAWMARVSARPDGYPRAHDMAQWVASMPPNCSWADTLVAVARDGRDDILYWADEKHKEAHSGERSVLAFVAAAAYGSDRLVRSLCAVGLVRTGLGPRRPPDWHVLACAIARGNVGIVRMLIEDGWPLGVSALFFAALCPDEAILRHVRIAFRRQLPDGRINAQLGNAIAWLATLRLCHA
ncbi:hypothetical protein TW95_gp1066 [Pandoravirus inopinatum]|uniref:Ankyrin repeat protein n=1 Tax=Pandoravirus inopinatum TaxID=1605721 RepID=A0A0B5J7F5_9VIRU|nr:hypothetical protein TW95_gp1066 [Pandoravirus inopinatum]AJF97800.1 hypothetical protein [Pandoravirus inopinatum]